MALRWRNFAPILSTHHLRSAPVCADPGPVLIGPVRGPVTVQLPTHSAHCMGIGVVPVPVLVGACYLSIPFKRLSQLAYLI